MEKQFNLFGEDQNKTIRSSGEYDLQKVISEFERIKSLGYVPNNRPRNRDGGIGNTFEDHLGVTENNLRDPDFEGFEIKTKRALSQAYTSLFSKSPSFPARGANAYLKDMFGEVRDPKFPDLKKLYASIFCNRFGTVYDKYRMTLHLDRKNEKLHLIVKDLDEKETLSDTVYWTFNDLRTASSKMRNLFAVTANRKKIEGLDHFHYTEAIVLIGFNFEKFLDCMEKGVIQFDIRMGVHGSGKNYGKPHDHGSGFRIMKNNLQELFDNSLDIS